MKKVRNQDSDLAVAESAPRTRIMRGTQNDLVKFGGLDDFADMCERAARNLKYLLVNTVYFANTINGLWKKNKGRIVLFENRYEGEADEHEESDEYECTYSIILTGGCKFIFEIRCCEIFGRKPVGAPEERGPEFFDGLPLSDQRRIRRLFEDLRYPKKTIARFEKILDVKISK